MGEKSEEKGIFDYLNQIFVGNIEEIETYSHIEWEEEFKEDVDMTMTGFSDILVRRGREEGREETTVKFIWSLHEMKCTDEMISEAVKRPVDYVQDILKKMHLSKKAGNTSVKNRLIVGIKMLLQDLWNIRIAILVFAIYFVIGRKFLYSLCPMVIMTDFLVRDAGLQERCLWCCEETLPGHGKCIRLFMV